MSAPSVSKGHVKPDSDVHITFEDQQRINEFARRNAKLDDFKEELKNKQNELQNLDDAFGELELMDEDSVLPFQMGEIFLHQDLENTQESLAEEKEKVRGEIEEIKKKCNEITEIMTDLKTLLYAKFGNHINLEDEE